MTLKHLQDLVAGFHPPDAAQGSYQLRMLDLASSEGDPTSRDRFDPGHFTASGFVASPNGTEVLLIHHRKIGRWLQPGGHIEPDDISIEEAIRREIEEETSLKDMESLGLLDLDIHQFPARGVDPAHLHFDVRYGFRAGSDTVAPGGGTLDVRWMPFGDLNRWNQELSVTRPASALAELVR